MEHSAGLGLVNLGTSSGLALLAMLTGIAAVARVMRVNIGARAWRLAEHFY